MRLFDCHTHTLCSPDSTAPLEDMAAAALDRGLAGLCTTDHCDLIDDAGRPIAAFDWAEITAQFEQVGRGLPPGFQLYLGLELGCGHLNPQLSHNIVSGAPLDFVLGSVHNLSPHLKGMDFFFLKFKTEQDCVTSLEDYFASIRALAPMDCYDSLAHIDYPLRYMHRDGFPIRLMDYQPQLREIFRSAAETGHALEVNTNRGRSIAQWREILPVFLDCGGEMVTIGSDAHTPEDVGRGLEEARQLLSDCGLRYYAVFQRRKPQFIRL